MTWAAGGTLRFTYRVTLDVSVEPDQALVFGAVADGTSLDGDPGPNLGTAVGASGTVLGERTGSGVAPNNLRATSAATVRVKDDSGITLTVGPPAVGTRYRVGELVTLTARVRLQEGTLDGVRIDDALPAGLALVDFQALSPATGKRMASSTCNRVVVTRRPRVRPTRCGSWGRVVNAGDANGGNDTLTLVYRARVLDAAALPKGLEFDHCAECGEFAL